jgi:PPOX class probable F420-dependent enzyme
MPLTPRQARFVDSLRVARLATAGNDGQPHIVPICFARNGDAIYTAIDRKPKRTTALRRVQNIRETGHAAVLFDHYSEDWSSLGWVMVRGPASLVVSPGEREQAFELLRARYAQYRAMDLSESPLIRVTANQVATWGNLN